MPEEGPGARRKGSPWRGASPRDRYAGVGQSAMVLLLWLVLTAPAVFACDGFYGCLKADLLQAFSRIASSDSYRLVPGLTFDRRPDRPRSLGLEPPKSGIVTVADVYSGAEKIFKTHSLFWNVLPGIDVSVSEGKEGNFVLGVQRCHHGSESRTFGVMRRMKMIMLPVMYKLGVITTLLTLLTVFALKGLTIGVLLLVMSSAGLAAKFKYSHYGPQAWPASKEVHVHVHGGGSHHSYHPPVHFDDPWMREDRHPEPASWIQHQPPPPPPPPRSTPSPWASYLGDHSL